MRSVEYCQYSVPPDRWFSSWLGCTPKGATNPAKVLGPSWDGIPGQKTEVWISQPHSLWRVPHRVPWFDTRGCLPLGPGKWVSSGRVWSTIPCGRDWCSVLMEDASSDAEALGVRYGAPWTGGTILSRQEANKPQSHGDAAPIPTQG